MKYWGILLLAGILCACTSTREVYTIDGNVIYGFSCKVQSYQDCMEDVGEWCGTLGYKFVNPDGSPAQPPSPPTAAPAQPAQATQMAPRGNNLDSTSAATAASTAQSTEPASPPAGYKLQRKFFVRCQS